MSAFSLKSNATHELFKFFIDSKLNYLPSDINIFFYKAKLWPIPLGKHEEEVRNMYADITAPLAGNWEYYWFLYFLLIIVRITQKLMV